MRKREAIVRTDICGARDCTSFKRKPLGQDLQRDGAGDFLEQVGHRLLVVVSNRLEGERLPVIQLDQA